MKFENIIGNRKIIEQLIQTIYNKNHAQSYIFEGREGIGKTSIAKLFSAGLICENFNNNPCEKCRHCVKIISNNHPDIYEVFADGASIKTKQIEELHEFIISKPFLADKKIILIHDADKMTIASQNKLLKTLEEPPLNTILILITSNVSILLPTIRSRCQMLSFHRLSKDEISTILIKKYNISMAEAQAYAALSDGSVGIAFKNVSDEDFYNVQKLVISFLSNAINNKNVSMLNDIELLAQKKDTLDTTFMMMKLWIRDIVLLNLTLDKNMLFNLEHIEELESLMHKRSLETWMDIIDNIEKARQQHKSYVQPELILQALGLNIQEDIHGNSYRRPF